MTSLTGCGIGPAMTEVDTPAARLGGIVHGGNSPVTGSVINLYATVSTATATTSGYSESGAGGVNLLATVTSDSNGNFTFGTSPTYTCPAGQYAYIQAVGGNPGLGTTPTSSPINFVAAIGPCSSLSTSTFVVINEVTTVAAAYALSGFVNTAQFGFVTDSTNTSGLGHAFLNAANLAGLQSVASANTQTAGGNGVVPTAEINTLADILEDCANSSGTTSTPCTNLFAAATPQAATSIAAPTDTWSAALDIAKYPAAAPGTLFGLVSATPAFLPALSGAPADWTVGISYGGLSGVQYLAIDGNDNVYVSENNSTYGVVGTSTSTYNASVVELSSNGVQSSTNLATGTSGTLSTFTDPDYLTVDTSNNLWVANGGATAVPATGKTQFGPANSNVVFELPSGNGTVVSYQTTGYDDPESLAVDSSNNIWIGNGNKSGSAAQYALTNLNAASSYAFTTHSTYGNMSSGPTGIAFDKSQTLWGATGFSYKVYRFASPYTATDVALNLTENDPQQVAIDSAGNGWTLDQAYSTTPGALTEVAAYPATTQTIYPSIGGLSSATTNGVYGIAIDGLGNIWMANTGGNGVVEFNPFIGTSAAGSTGTSTASGTALSESGGFTPSAVGGSGNLFSSPYQLAVDAAGALWVTNKYGTSVVQVLGVAAPTTAVLAKQNFGTLP